MKLVQNQEKVILGKIIIIDEMVVSFHTNENKKDFKPVAS
jgi:hypothetical protein